MDVMASSQVGCVHNGCHGFLTGRMCSQWIHALLLTTSLHIYGFLYILFVLRITPDPLAQWEEEVTAGLGRWELKGWVIFHLSLILVSNLSAAKCIAL